ncbi:MAG TPA: hypothetical protein VGG24_01720 [Paraburkholderia sp.]
MNRSVRAAAPATRADRVASLRLRTASFGTLGTLPRLAHAATGREAHVYAVVAAFGLLVAAAIVGLIAAVARGRRQPSAEGEPPRR